MQKKQKRMEIKTLFLIFTALLLTSLILVSGVLVLNSYKKMQADNTTNTLHAIETIGAEADNIFYSFENTFEFLSNSSDIEKILMQPISDLSYNLLSYFGGFKSLNRYINDIGIISGQMSWSDVFSKAELAEITSDITQPKLTSIGIYNPSSVRFPSQQMLFAGAIYGGIESSFFQQQIGTITISVHPYLFLQNQQTVERFLSFYFMDGNGNSYPLLENSKALPALSGGASVSSAVTKYTASGELVYQYQIAGSDCVLVGQVNTDLAFQQAKSTFLTTLVLCCIILAAIITLFFIVFQNIVLPINRLEHSIANSRKSSVTPISSIKVEDGCAEIVSLGDEFNRMIRQNHNLNKSLLHTTENLYRLELEKERAEISHLKSQINPHFLYNTLETIKGLALEGGNTQIATISIAMGKMFRYSIKGKQVVLLPEELDIAKAYLQIQKMRFKDRLETIFSITDETRGCYVSKMLLQPILENSVIHGLADMEKGGILWVGARIENGDLLLTIQDNGVGIPEANLKLLRKQLQKDNATKSFSEHIGLANVSQRIKLQHNNHYGLEIESVEEEGTRVILRLPIISKPTQEDTNV